MLEDLTGSQLFVTGMCREAACSNILRMSQDEDVSTVGEDCGPLVKINDP